MSMRSERESESGEQSQQSREGREGREGRESGESGESDEWAESEESAMKTLANDMFGKTSAYLRAELKLSLDDYKLLEDMNSVTTSKYSEMNEIAVNVSQSVAAMNESYTALLPHLNQVDRLEERVSRLEQMAYAIDAYSKRLESKYKQMERK